MELYNNYSKQLRERIGDGERVQKISVNGGFTCPNRDGKVGTVGCMFCMIRRPARDYLENYKTI